MRLNRAIQLGVSGLAVVLVCGSTVLGQIVINEVVYDEAQADSSDVVPDTREFVELYNSGAAAVDIGGWMLSTVTLLDGATSFTDTIPAGTMLAPGDYWVMGATGVPNVDQDLGSGFEIFPDVNILLELKNSGGTLVDAISYEVNKNPQLGNATPAQIAQVGNGWWGNTQSYNSTYTRISLGRYVDGRDTNNNGRDFGTIPLTPGTSNTLPLNSTYAIPDVDALSVGSPMPSATGSFYRALVIDPTDAYAAGVDPDPLTDRDNPALNMNPNAIPASPQGGKALIAWDPSGGGNLAISTERVDQFDLYAYLDTTPYGAAGAESSAYGIGTAGPLFNTPNPSGGAGFGTLGGAADMTGLAWVFQKETNTSEPDHVKLVLVDANDGGDSRTTAADWTVITTIDLEGDPSAWHRLGIDVDAAGNVIARYDDQVFNFTTSTNLMGTFYVGYRESLVGTPITDYPEKVRPPTFDMVVAAQDDADFDNDNDVDGNDFLIWQRGLGVGTTNATGDANASNSVNAADLAIWKAQFGLPATAAVGAVPEPGTLGLALLALGAALVGGKPRRFRSIA